MPSPSAAAEKLAKHIDLYLKDPLPDNYERLLLTLGHVYSEKTPLLFLLDDEASVDSDGIPALHVGPLDPRSEDLALFSFTTAKTRMKACRRAKTDLPCTSFPFFIVWEYIKRDPEIKTLVIDERFFTKEEILKAMKMRFKQETRIEALVADITKLKCDAIVNAANKTLLGGGGVDGAIHKAAGPKLKAACSRLGGCKTGEAKITQAYKLPSLFVIHTVGPIYATDPEPEAHLAECYRNSLNLAKEMDLHTIAFPAISTGAYGFPAEKAALIAYETVYDWTEANNDYPIVVTFCCFDGAMLGVYNEAYQKYLELHPKKREGI